MSQPTNSKEPAGEAAFGEAAPGDERTADEQKTEEKTYPAKVVEVHRIPYRARLPGDLPATPSKPALPVSQDHPKQASAHPLREPHIRAVH